MVERSLSLNIKNGGFYKEFNFVLCAFHIFQIVSDLDQQKQTIFLENKINQDKVTCKCSQLGVALAIKLFKTGQVLPISCVFPGFLVGS